MSTPYEVEHNIKAAPGSQGRRRRKIDMSTFDSHLRAITGRTDDDTTNTTHAHTHHSLPPPTPADTSALYRFVQDQFAMLARTAPSQDNRDLLQELIEALSSDVDAPPEQIRGVSQQYLDGLDRVPKRRLRSQDTCPICADRYLDDPYPLVVELPCHGSHRFDLECVGPWLMSKGTCPMCRKDLTEKKKPVKPVPKAGEEEEEEEDGDMLYA